MDGMVETLNSEKIPQTEMAFWALKKLLSAIEMDVFTELSHGPESFDSLSGRLGLHPRSAHDFLDALVTLGFVIQNADIYANTPETDFFFDREKPPYIGGILEITNTHLYPSRAHLTEALRSDVPQNETRTDSTGLFDTFYTDPARLNGFLGTLTGISHDANIAMARAFPWKDYQTFVDVGTAQGDLAIQIALANPHMQGTGFDLPEVAPIFEEYAGKAGVSDRLAYQPGDFFRQEIPKADVVLMGHILHDWDLPTKKMLVKKAYDALPAGGALVVYETTSDNEFNEEFDAYEITVENERSNNTFGLMMKLNSSIDTPEGSDYTGRDCSSWMEEAGFSATRVEHLVGLDSMVIAIK